MFRANSVLPGLDSVLPTLGIALTVSLIAPGFLFQANSVLPALGIVLTVSIWIAPEVPVPGKSVPPRPGQCPPEPWALP